MSSKNRKRKKQVRLLIILWICFLLMMGGMGFCLYRYRDQLFVSAATGDGDPSESGHDYTVNSNQDINTLITIYMKAMATADQTSLQASVTTPSQFDDMTMVEAKAQIITDYSNINCYYMDGLTEDTYVVYVVMNIAISGVQSQPLDVYDPLYIVKKDGKYLIDNSAFSEEIRDHIDKTTANKDIQSLYMQVKEDRDSKAAEDKTLMDFLNRLNN